MEKNPKQENEELLEQSHENDSHQVEPEKEKNPQPETVNQHEIDNEMGEGKTKSFKNRLFTISYQPKNSNNILTTGEKYKPKIREKVQEYINHGIRFYLVYEVELEKYDADWKEDTKTVYLNSANKRKTYMEELILYIMRLWTK